MTFPNEGLIWQCRQMQKVIMGQEKQLREANAEIFRQQLQVRRRELLLQSLTPMGSEYVNDPERCVAYAREVRTGHFERWKKVALENRDLRRQLDEAKKT